MEIEKIAKHLARGIFKAGDQNDGLCNRIQFKGGHWPETEVDQGGLCEAGLELILVRLLREAAKDG